MAGVVLGTGSGVLAAAAVYYTLSTSLRESTASLRGELANSNALLHSSFTSVPPPAASSLVGPSSLGEPRFGDIVRQKWNTALSSAFTSIRTTNYTAIGLAAWDSSKDLVNQLSSSSPSSSPTTTTSSTRTGSTGQSGSEGHGGVVELLHDGVEKVKDGYEASVKEVEKGLHRASDGLHKVSEQVKHGMDQVRDAAELLEKRVEAAKDGAVGAATDPTAGPSSIIAKPGQAESGLRGTETFTGGSAIVVKTQRELERNRGRLV